MPKGVLLIPGDSLLCHHMQTHALAPDKTAPPAPQCLAGEGRIPCNEAAITFPQRSANADWRRWGAFSGGDWWAEPLSHHVPPTDESFIDRSLEEQFPLLLGPLAAPLFANTSDGLLLSGVTHCTPSLDLLKAGNHSHLLCHWVGSLGPSIHPSIQGHLWGFATTNTTSPDTPYNSAINLLAGYRKKRSYLLSAPDRGH